MHPHRIAPILTSSLPCDMKTLSFLKYPMTSKGWRSPMHQLLSMKDGLWHCSKQELSLWLGLDSHHE